MRVNGEGPIPSRIMIVGEAPNDSDIHACVPFSGGAGQELNKLLHEAGLERSECYTTYVVKTRPPEGRISSLIAVKKKEIMAAHVLLQGQYVLPKVTQGYQELLVEIEMVQPNIIIALGNVALGVLTGHWNVMKWRGSMLTSHVLVAGLPVKVIPSLHPSTLFKQFDLRAAVLNDFRRVKRHMTTRVYENKPVWDFLIRPDFDLVIKTVVALTNDAEHFTDPVWLDLDIETRYGHMDCIGFSWSRRDAICIPLISRGHPEGHWNLDEETAIVFALYKLFTHPNVKIRWQNGLYDAQYIFRHWHFIPNHGQDTMISQHSLFAALPKGLAFIASLYADWYVYWKDEGKIANDLPEEQRWRYNLQDCIYTRECGEVLSANLASMGLAEVDKKQQALFPPVLLTMIRGIKVRPEMISKMAVDIQEELSHREAFLFNVLGHPLNPNSPKQMQVLFYEDLKQPPILKRTVVAGRIVMRPTCDDEALQKIAAKEPLLKPLANCIADIRTLNKFLGDFVMMPLDNDGRMRCSFNIAGDAAGKSAPYSYRLSSSKNAFDSGGNLQTIPSKNSKSSGKAAARGSMDFQLPNIKTMYGPDAGFTFFDMDLDRADLQVVVWESEDEMLKAALRMGVDIHLLNTYSIDNVEPPPLDELIETHPRYADHRGPRKYKREFAKVFCHACITAGHEVLTRNGWFAIEHLPSRTEIAVWDKDTSAIRFEVPSAFTVDFAEPGETLLAFEGQAFSQEVTSDHTMPCNLDGKESIKSFRAFDVPSSARIPTTGFYSGTRSADEVFMRLLAAFQADGFFDYKYRVGWHLKKQRKIKRLLWLLEQAGIAPNIQINTATRIFIYWRPADWMKIPGAWMLELNGQALDWWLDELRFWDGYQGPTGAVHISSSNETAAEWINTIAQLRGYGSRCYVQTPAKENRKANWHISLNNRRFASVSSMQILPRVLTQRTPVYCPQTTTGFFMVRRGGKISVTGNSNYLGRAKTISAHTGRLVHEIEGAQKRWFAAHPGILAWHKRVTEQVLRHRFVENKFGYRWYIFDRIDEQLLPAAVAWIPQSTVGIVINRAWLNFHEHLPEVQVLVQVHDSLGGQFPTHRKATLLPLMEHYSRIVIPYEDPLIIPTGVKTSEVSWGDCL